ncbi:MAG: YceI family protein [Sulfurovum sp.]|nr:MAG: YceI family protein [Sulfurovum sp.]
MRKTLFSLITLASLLSADGGCVLVQSNDMNVTWKAYKTFAKLGVGGQFTGVSYTANKKEGKNFKSLLVGSKVSIDVSKIDTKNKGRDKTLVENFFGKLKGKTIDGVVVDIKADEKVNGKSVYHGSIDVNITMNGQMMQIPMRYNYKNEIFTAKGTIDLFDFSANDALKSINKSCFALHKGKTWNDVSIEFSTSIKATLCDTKIK